MEIRDKEGWLSSCVEFEMLVVTTLALGSQPRQGLARLWAKTKPGSEGKCEGMNPHTPKGASTLGVWSPG